MDEGYSRTWVPQESIPAGDASSILIIEEHDIIRSGLVQIIDSQDDLNVSAAVKEGRQGLELLEEAAIELILLDLTLPDCHGLQLIRAIKKRHSSCRILAFSMTEDLRYGQRALLAGAHGYISRSTDSNALLTAIREVAAGGVWLSTPLQERIINARWGRKGARRPSPLDALSDRELEVLKMLGDGHSSSEIAKQLERSVKTIEAHRENIKRKLSLRSATELMRYAVCWVEEEKRLGL